MKEEISCESLMLKLHTIRGKIVMLDFDLAQVFGLKRSGLLKAVSSNKARFPADFCFSLVKKEIKNIRYFKLQSGQKCPLRIKAFTLPGIAMLAVVLKTEKAVKASIKMISCYMDLNRIICNNLELTLFIQKLKLRQDIQDESGFKSQGQGNSVIELLNQFFDLSS